MSQKTVALTLCVQCGTPGSERARNGRKRANPENKALAVTVKDALMAQNGGAAVQVRLSRCQQNCTNPCAWQLASADREALQFGKAGMPGGSTAEDIATVACQYAALGPGQKIDKQKFPPAVKGTMVARVAPWPRPAK